MTEESNTQAGSSCGEMPNSLQFAHVGHKLKHLERTGWVRNQISKPETVASHMYRMAIMSAFLIDEPGLDINKCIKMSLCHDIGESIIGDITPQDGVPEKVKHDRELAAVTKISKLVSPSKGEEILSLFEEYEECKTPEARLVLGLDRLDMIIQAYEYELQENKRGFLQDFFDSTKEFFTTTHPAVKELVEKLYAARDANIPFKGF